MTTPATITAVAPLPALVRQAADALARAETAAQVLDARDAAGEAYSKAKRAARLMKARAAADELIAAAHRAQADALEIEAQANRRLADEYDGAQARGEVAKHGGDRSSKVPVGNVAPTAAEIGLSRKQIFEARRIRDAIAQDPGIVRQALDELIEEGSEPTRAALRRLLDGRRANLRAAIGTDTASKAERGDNLYETPAEAVRALLALESFGPVIWEPACGKGAISRLLEDAGYEVVLSDLVDYGTADRHGECQHVIDFRMTGPDWLTAAGHGQADICIVTNPPYGEALNAFVSHALRVHRPRRMALLLNLNFLCGFDDPDRCFAMDECPPARILVFTRRLPMMHRDGWDGPIASSRMNTAWFVWERDEAGGYRGALQVRRVDWKEFQDDSPASRRAPAAPPPAPPAGLANGPDGQSPLRPAAEKKDPDAPASRARPEEAGAAPPPAAPASAVKRGRSRKAVPA